MKWFALIVVFLLLPRPVAAVPPPDFVFNVWAQMMQAFSFIFVFLSGSISFLIRRFRPAHIVLAIVAVLVVAGAGAYWYGLYRQRQALSLWLADSKKYEQYYAETAPRQNPESATSGGLDQLQVGSTSSTLLVATSTFYAAFPLTDAYAKFIADYYQSIAEHNFARAYAMSAQTVNIATFKSWYAGVDRITLDKLVRIDDRRSSLELTLFEGPTVTRYGVVMSLSVENGLPVRVAGSLVRTLETAGALAATSITSLSNDEFRALISHPDEIFVLDAREDLEFENGHFPGSAHIRFADLVAGRWIEVPTGKTIVVICWSGIRGKEVAEFLRGKELSAQFLVDGAIGWYNAGGLWEGNVVFSARYQAEQYTRTFTTAEIKDAQARGIVIVDSREPWKFNKWHIPGSVNIPIFYTPTVGFENAFSQVRAGAEIITVCDAYVNCFDAKITGVELERRGHNFLGRYARPWEYGK